MFKKIIFLLSLFFTHPCFPQFTVSGKVTGQSIDQITIYKPIGSFFNLNNDISAIKVSLSPNNTFKTKIISQCSSGFITIRIGQRNLYLLFSVYDSIYLNINLNKEKDWIYFGGSNAIGQKMLNSYLSEPIRSFGAIYDYFDSKKTPKQSPIQFLQAHLANQTFFLDSLYKQKKISNNFYSLATKAVFASQSDEFIKPFLRPSKIQSIYDRKTINLYLDSVFTIVSPTDSALLGAFTSNLYVDSYYCDIEKRLKGYPDIFKIKDTAFVDAEGKMLRVTDIYTPYLHVKNPVVKEYLWANIFHGIQNIFPEAIKATDIDAFEKLFPKSIFLPEMKKAMDKLNKKIVNKNNPEIIIIDSTDMLNSLIEVHNKYFKGELLYVDLWASWCIPCKNEFSYNQLIDSVLHSKNIKRLYISFDEKSAEDSWMNNVYNFKLKGMNMIPNTNLKNDILKKVYDNTISYSIPRYILIAKSGNIITANAPHPSDPKLIPFLNKIVEGKL